MRFVARTAGQRGAVSPTTCASSPGGGCSSLGRPRRAGRQDITLGAELHRPATPSTRSATPWGSGTSRAARTGTVRDDRVGQHRSGDAAQLLPAHHRRRRPGPLRLRLGHALPARRRSRPTARTRSCRARRCRPGVAMGQRSGLSRGRHRRRRRDVPAADELKEVAKDPIQDPVTIKEIGEGPDPGPDRSRRSAKDPIQDPSRSRRRQGPDPGHDRQGDGQGPHPGHGPTLKEAAVRPGPRVAARSSRSPRWARLGPPGQRDSRAMPFVWPHRTVAPAAGTSPGRSRRPASRYAKELGAARWPASTRTGRMVASRWRRRRRSSGPGRLMLTRGQP